MSAGENGDPARGKLPRTYRRIAPFYDLVDLPFEYGRYRAIRPLLFEGLSGRILDAGVGTGRNMAFYPKGADVVGVDLSPEMLERAKRRAMNAPASVQLLPMDVTRLDFADASFDSAVASFLFCTLPDELRIEALRELNRIVRPNSRIRLLDYAPAQRPFRRATAKLFGPWVRWAFGASLDRDTAQLVREAGLVVTHAQYVTGSIQFIEARAMPLAQL